MITSDLLFNQYCLVARCPDCYDTFDAQILAQDFQEAVTKARAGQVCGQCSLQRFADELEEEAEAEQYLDDDEPSDCSHCGGTLPCVCKKREV